MNYSETLQDSAKELTSILVGSLTLKQLISNTFLKILPQFFYSSSLLVKNKTNKTQKISQYFR